MSRMILISVVIGIALMGFGLARRANGTATPGQARMLIVAGIFFQSWWVILALLFLIKTYVFRQDT